MSQNAAELLSCQSVIHALFLSLSLSLSLSPRLAQRDETRNRFIIRHSRALAFVAVRLPRENVSGGIREGEIDR